MTEFDGREARVCDLVAMVAVLARQEVDGWITHGPVTDQMQYALIRFEGQRYALVRDNDRTVLVFTQGEWDAFKDGINKGEFDMEMGLREAINDARKPNDKSAL